MPVKKIKKSKAQKVGKLGQAAADAGEYQIDTQLQFMSIEAAGEEWLKFAPTITKEIKALAEAQLKKNRAKIMKKAEGQVKAEVDAFIKSLRVEVF